MRTKLFWQALTKFVIGLLTVCLLLFLPAGTFHYWRGWLLLALLFIPMFIAGIILLLKNPDLLAKRLNSKEKEEEQKSVIILSALMFIGGFILAGLDYRFGWSQLPNWLIVAASASFIFGYGLCRSTAGERISFQNGGDSGESESH